MKKTYVIISAMLCLWGGMATAQFKPLVTFNGSNGSEPLYTTPLLNGSQLFCVVAYGGASDSGSLFSVDTNGTGYVDLHDFRNATGGAYPVGNMILSGNILYGVAALGGAHDSGCIYTIHTDGSGYKDIYDFRGPTGGEPIGGLIKLGNKFYGTTVFGGAAHKGVVYSIDTDGTNYLDLHDFTGIGGSEPLCNLTSSGNVLYGITASGGANDSGSVFSIHTDGSRFTDIFDFTGPNGMEPLGGVVISGNTLYGISSEGGAFGQGVIFSIDTTGGNYFDLHDFITGSGINPFCYLTLKNSTLLGTTTSGGGSDSGCIFSILTDGGSYRDLYDFNHTAYEPELNGLVVSGETIYGLTTYGGLTDNGVLFSFTNPILGVTTIAPITGHVSVYPNPSTGTFNFAISHPELVSGSQTVEVYNELGQQVYTNTIVHSSSFIVDLNNQPNGVYLYKVTSETGSLTGQGKLVIQK